MAHRVYDLPDWTEGTTHLVMQVPWEDENGNEIDLTGAALTGLLLDRQTNLSRLIAGTLEKDAETDHYMKWTMDAADPVAGRYEVQFRAVYSDRPALTFRANWYVEGVIPEPAP